jgi:hypothetical protein
VYQYDTTSSYSTTSLLAISSMHVQGSRIESDWLMMHSGGIIGGHRRKSQNLIRPKNKNNSVVAFAHSLASKTVQVGALTRSSSDRTRFQFEFVQFSPKRLESFGFPRMLRSLVHTHSMTNMSYYIVSRTLWFCLSLVLTSQSGIAFTVQADQQHSLEAKTTLTRGGSSTGRARKSLNPTAATKEALAVSSGSVSDEGINEIKSVDAVSSVQSSPVQSSPGNSLDT